MRRLKTAIELSKNLFTTGAIFQTSKKVEKEICTHISDQPNMVYIEFGMGHGNITKEILKRISPSSKVYSFEINKDFCDKVKNEISDDRLQIINDHAENIDEIIPAMVDGIISSLPLTIFSKKRSNQIINAAYQKMHSGSIYSQILYSKIHKSKFTPVFDSVNIIPVSQLPPEFIYHSVKH